MKKEWMELNFYEKQEERFETIRYYIRAFHKRSRNNLSIQVNEDWKYQNDDAIHFMQHYTEALANLNESILISVDGTKRLSYIRHKLRELFIDSDCSLFQKIDFEQEIKIKHLLEQMNDFLKSGNFIEVDKYLKYHLIKFKASIEKVITFELEREFPKSWIRTNPSRVDDSALNKD